jgi:hypothetical protein
MEVGYMLSDLVVVSVREFAISVFRCGVFTQRDGHRMFFVAVF